jgi:DNA polymerase alpha subunit A
VNARRQLYDKDSTSSRQQSAPIVQQDLDFAGDDIGYDGDDGMVDTPTVSTDAITSTSSPPPTAATAAAAASTTGPDIAPPEDEEVHFENAGADWLEVQKNASSEDDLVVFDDATADSTKVVSPTALTPGGKLTMYWVDAYEVPNRQSGNLYLFGRALVPPTGDAETKTKDKQRTVSCCVTVRNTQRVVYVKPRDYARARPTDPSSKTDKKVTMVDVYEEFKKIASQFNISQWRSKAVTKKFCFQDTGTADVEKEAPYLKVVYNSQFPALPLKLCGKTFSHVFGVRSSPMELFFLERRLMGPCWLTVSNAVSAAENNVSVSWAKSEFYVDSPKHVEVIPSLDAPDFVPTLKTMSLSIKTVLDPNSHTHEIVMVSALTHNAVHLDGPTPNETQLSHFTAMRPLTGTSLPFDMQRTLTATRSRTQICGNEFGLLNFVLAQIHMEDPDILVGHDLHGFMIEALLHRFQRLKIPNWSKIGRLKKTKIPKSSAGGGFSVVDQGVASGRLLVDTLVSSKELIREKTYSLTHLAKTQLSIVRREVDVHKTRECFVNTKDIMNLIQLNENDAFLSLKLMYKLVIVPLTHQLTSLCGNLWARSLRSARAERIEYLLLHEFHDQNYIPPEKYTGKETRARMAAAEETEESASGNGGDSGGHNNGHADHHADHKNNNRRGPKSKIKGSGRKKRKPQYSGGLVLEPIKGFYDSYVVMLDFNSLYPSIIREFNICFTTIDATLTDEHGRAHVPDSSLEEGILPLVLKRLLDRRKAVKGLLKAAVDPVKKRQLDIRQKAIKLVANSMYGCLGFSYSRFYCKPLASLVTAQGRDILQRTVDLASSLGYNVIYGDTDSIMIATGTNDLEQVRKIGNEVRKAVNRQFRVLEISIDGMFKNMLLLRKKKYAALVVSEGPNGKLITTREDKGLDMVRRDWSGISRDVCEFMVEQILSGRKREDVIEAIHNHMRELVVQINNNKIGLAKFVITKGLTKAPHEYPNDSMPHVRVAMQMQKDNLKVRVGDFIPYIIVEGDSKSLADRAMHPAAYSKAHREGKVKVDVRWYLENQVLPPAARLVAPIEETNAAVLAECLGLDSRKFAHMAHDHKVDDADNQLNAVDETIDYEEQYSHCEPLRLTCPLCKHSNAVPGVYDIENHGRSGLMCSTPDCRGMVTETAHINHLTNQLDMEVRRIFDKYYARWAVCSDPSCRLRTRHRSMKRGQLGSPCLITGCAGVLLPEYSSSQAYYQLRFWTTMFDVPAAKKKLEAENKQRTEAFNKKEEVQMNLRSHEKVFKHIHTHMMRIVDQIGTHWVDSSALAFHTGSSSN